MRDFISEGLRFSTANFTQYLIVRTIVLVKIFFWSFAIRASAVIGNITCRTALNRLNFITVTPFDVRNKLFVMPNMALDDKRRFIDLKLLILRRMRIIKDPLLERDVFTNKIKKIQNNLQKVLILYK